MTERPQGSKSEVARGLTTCPTCEGSGVIPDVAAKSIASQSRSERAQIAGDLHQTASERDQTASDLDQTMSDHDQTASDVDKDSSAEDQAAADRDLADGADPVAYTRSRAARAHAAAIRAAVSTLRDESAATRAATAEDRDRVAAERDRATLERHRPALLGQPARWKIEIASRSGIGVPSVLTEGPTVIEAEVEKALLRGELLEGAASVTNDGRIGASWAIEAATHEEAIKKSSEILRRAFTSLKIVASDAVVDYLSVERAERTPGDD